MNWKEARRIQTDCQLLATQSRARLTKDFRKLRRKLDNIDRAVILAIVEEELKAIAKSQLEIFDKITEQAYLYSNKAILSYDLLPIDKSKAMGYNRYWCADGRSYVERIPYNLEGIRHEIEGLILGFDGDFIVLMGLLSDIMDKAYNQFNRLLITELEASYSMGARDAYLEQGCYYAIIENDNPCDAVCADLVGEYEVPLSGDLGIELPPYHPNCQCVFLGIFGR